MFCSNCGAQVGENEKFCGACGTPVKAQAAAPVMQQAPVYQQPAPAPVPQPVMPQPQMQPAPAIYQQPVQAAPQVVPDLAKAKGGPRRACFVVGLITCIMLILETLPVFAIGAMMFFVGPLAMMFGASNSEDLFGYGLLICLGGFILLDMAIISIVFNGICTKITKKRPASKCRSLRMAAAVMTMINATLVVAPVIGANYMMSDAEFMYAIFAVTFIMAIIFLVLAVITNSKEKKLASA